MKNKRIKFIINIFLVVILLMQVFSTISQANSINEWMEQGSKFIDNGKNGGQKINPDTIKNTVIPIARALIAVGTVVLVVVTFIMGIKYMMCSSAEQKAKLKTQLIGLVVATVVIFGAQVIWSVIYKFMIDLTE